jgi:hypothetical protein
MLSALVMAGALPAEPVRVLREEGVVHGFLVLRTLDGIALADGDLIQVARGDRVTSRLVFHFKDGSVHDDTVVFSQRGRFRLVSDHLIQKGPTFPRPIDVTVNASSGEVTVSYREDDGKEKLLTERMELPEDVSNGLMFTLLKNIDSKAAATTVSMVAATPKPRLVKLVVSPEGEDAFSIGSSSRKAIRYVVKVEIGGIAGLVASLLGKKPPDTHLWVMTGEAPAFVKSEGPLYFGGPVWRIELASPTWPRQSAAAAPPS